MYDTLTHITLVAGIATIVGFIWDVRKQNSKVLKSILDIQKTHLMCKRHNQRF